MKFNIVFIILSYSYSLFSQPTYDPLQPPNTFRHSDNPNYWKNRMPFSGYWQQDVHYTIKVDVNEKTDIITGTEQLVYWNNSPDTLDFVFFHLYQNAFQPDAYYDDLQKNNDVKPQYGLYESQKKGTEIHSLKIGDKKAKTELDNTILKVILNKPLKPNESVTFDINFSTYFDGSGGVRRRMKTFDSYGNKHYDGVHWYPRISVYDRKFGWTTDQHLGREFYGDFGTYDVELTFTTNFVLDATGNLINRKEVLPDDLRKKLDIANFSKKPWGENPSIITPYDSTKRKTWKFHAENVHDFAFTADPTYRIGEAEWNGKKCYALAQESHASRWQNAAEYTAKIIQTFSEEFGMYTYHKMIVADARDGMEYPMLTLDGGYDPEYRGLLVHEVGHNWFYGQVANNETYRASMDEGFTQFLTAWGLQKIDGDTIKEVPPLSGYQRKFSKPNLAIERSVYRAYLADALKEKDPPLNTHSDGFGGALRHGGGYRHVYYKTGTMLYNLQYVLGDELFQKAMKHYFDQWKICHPYYEDFRNSIINYTKRDLNWFFDQWLETTKRIDYGIKSVRKGNNENEYKIKFIRKERMQMPLDFSVYSKTGKEYKYLIPNDWFLKETDATILPRWIGWDKLKPEYEAIVVIPDGIKDVVIDPSNRLADINKLNNSKKYRVTLNLDHRVYNAPDQNNYELFTRPDVWYNAYDGVKAGFHMNGNYMNYLHKFDLTVWYNTGVGQQDLFSVKSKNEYDILSYRLTYSTATDKFIKSSSLFFSGKYLDGLHAYKLGMDKQSESEKTKLYTYFKTLYRPTFFSLNYLLYPLDWNPDKFNNTLNIGLDHNYNYAKGNGHINVEVRTPTLESDYNYSKISLNAVNTNNLGKFIVKTRLFAQYGTGNNWAPESQLYLAGANSEELMENKYTRSSGFIDQSLTGYGTGINNFHAGGGLNLRGYAGYLAPELIKGKVKTTYKGTSGAAFNTEIEFNKLVPIRPTIFGGMFDLKSYLFGDVGFINSNTTSETLSFANLRADAGVGTALTIQRWGSLQMINPFTVRFDMPLFVSSIPSTETHYVDFRWIIAINRAF